MEKNSSLIVAASMLLLAAPAVAEVSPVMGAGVMKCSEIAANPKQEGTYFSWAQGFMTGLNVGREWTGGAIADLKGEPWERQMAMIALYCGVHPDEEYVDAVLWLFKGLPKFRDKPIPPPSKSGH